MESLFLLLAKLAGNEECRALAPYPRWPEGECACGRLPPQVAHALTPPRCSGPCPSSATPGARPRAPRGSAAAATWTSSLRTSNPLLPPQAVSGRLIRPTHTPNSWAISQFARVLWAACGAYVCGVHDIMALGCQQKGSRLVTPPACVRRSGWGLRVCACGCVCARPPIPRATWELGGRRTAHAFRTLYRRFADAPRGSPGRRGRAVSCLGLQSGEDQIGHTKRFPVVVFVLQQLRNSAGQSRNLRTISEETRAPSPVQDRGSSRREGATYRRPHKAVSWATNAHHYICLSFSVYRTCRRPEARAWGLWRRVLVVASEGGGGGTRPRYSVVCLWRRPLASRHCSF